ncbi:DUF1523 family protein [Rhodobacterales bacterium HKCCE2091]|nr:DUF1523 family protein [Rhodobacterales bacterium HKCCE2091]
MRWARIIFLLLIALILGVFLHYWLPGRDVVRITGTDIIRTDLSGWNAMFYAQPDSGNSVQDSRDIRYINTVRENGNPSVYRNEDTGIGWPPYFKFSSQDLQAEASNLVSTQANPQWVVVTHYGWRSNFLSIYPNAVGLRAIDSPSDVSWIPWLNIGILLAMAAFVFFIWRIWERFEDRVLEPASDRMAVRWAKTRDWFAGRR